MDFDKCEGVIEYERKQVKYLYLLMEWARPDLLVSDVFESYISISDIVKKEQLKELGISSLKFLEDKSRYQDLMRSRVDTSISLVMEKYINKVQ